ncbi:MAG: hypothetical protein AABZ83_07765 [candidate division NC10 bacterium]
MIPRALAALALAALAGCATQVPPTGPLDASVAPLLHVRIEEQLERLRQEPTKEPALRLVLIALKKGAKLSLLVHAAGHALELRPGEIAILESAIEHEVEALEESGLLLTIVKPT